MSFPDEMASWFTFDDDDTKRLEKRLRVSQIRWGRDR